MPSKAWSITRIQEGDYQFIKKWLQELMSKGYDLGPCKIDILFNASILPSKMHYSNR